MRLKNIAPNEDQLDSLSLMSSSSSFAANNNKSAQCKQKILTPERKKEKSLDIFSSGCKCPTRSSSRILRKK